MDVTRDWRTFPEENPNLVIEANSSGDLLYINPVASERFPELEAQGTGHPLFEGFEEIVERFTNGHVDFVASEVDLGDSVFERKVCHSTIEDQMLVRVYAHDVTALRRAEEAKERLARAIAVAQEEERHRVSRELHDEAGQALVALKISLELMRDELVAAAPGVDSNLADAIGLVESTREQIRRIARDLRPPALDGLGLHMALDGFCKEFDRRTHLSIEYEGTDVPGVADAVETTLYRFLQECLTNAATHADAHHVTVHLSTDMQCITLSVTDDGRGIRQSDLQQADTDHGIGITGMRERIELLGGRLVIDSEPHNGATFAARLPIGRT